MRLPWLQTDGYFFELKFFWLKGIQGEGVACQTEKESRGSVSLVFGACCETTTGQGCTPV